MNRRFCAVRPSSGERRRPKRRLYGHNIRDRIFRMQESKTVIVMLDPMRMFTKGLLQGIGRYVRMNHRQWAFFRPSNIRQEVTTHSLTLMVSRLHADGVVVRQDEDIESVVKARIPVVTMNYFRKRLAGVANISSDMEQIGRMGAAHLLDRGFRHFAYCGYTDRSWSVKRHESFASVIARAGHHSGSYMTPESLDVNDWMSELEGIVAWLRGLPKPLGVMACNDDRGAQMIEACKVAGLRVPDDVAVVGVDNDPAICNFSNPRLSSVALNVEDAGFRAAEVLDCWMSGRKRNYTDVIVKPVRVATRESTDVVATDDREVSDAVRFIRDNASHAIQVGEVAECIGVSRRKLEARFRSVFGTSVLDRIRRARVERAMMMLVDTNQPIYEIARSLDYTGAPQFSRYFREVSGVSPSQYRLQYGGR